MLRYLAVKWPRVRIPSAPRSRLLMPQGVSACGFRLDTRCAWGSPQESGGDSCRPALVPHRMPVPRRREVGCRRAVGVALDALQIVDALPSHTTGRERILPDMRYPDEANRCQRVSRLPFSSATCRLPVYTRLAAGRPDARSASHCRDTGEVARAGRTRLPQGMGWLSARYTTGRNP